MENSNFNNLDDDQFEKTPLFNDMHDNIINRIGSYRTVGNVFGNFFHQFSGFIIMLLGGKR